MHEFDGNEKNDPNKIICICNCSLLTHSISEIESKRFFSFFFSLKARRSNEVVLGRYWNNYKNKTQKEKRKTICGECRFVDIIIIIISVLKFSRIARNIETLLTLTSKAAASFFAHVAYTIFIWNKEEDFLCVCLWFIQSTALTLHWPRIRLLWMSILYPHYNEMAIIHNATEK